MFNAFGEGYFCIWKRFLFLSFRRLYLNQFLHEIYIEKVLQKLFLHIFFGAHISQMVPKYIQMQQWQPLKMWTIKQLFLKLEFFMRETQGIHFSGSFPKYCIPLQPFGRTVPSFQEHLFHRTFIMTASVFGYL